MEVEGFDLDWYFQLMCEWIMNRQNKIVYIKDIERRNECYCNEGF